MKSSSAFRSLVVSKIPNNLSERNCLPSSLFLSHGLLSTFKPPKLQTSMLSTFKPPKLDDTSIFQRSFTRSYVPTRCFHLSSSTSRSVSHYETLGVDRWATQQEVDDAFNQLSEHLHSDKNSDSPYVAEMLDQLSAAYDIIGNKEKRFEYDSKRERDFDRILSYCGVGIGSVFFVGLVYCVWWFFAGVRQYNREQLQKKEQQQQQQQQHPEPLPSAPPS